MDKINSGDDSRTYYRKAAERLREVMVEKLPMVTSRDGPFTVDDYAVIAGIVNRVSKEAHEQDCNGGDDGPDA